MSLNPKQQRFVDEYLKDKICGCAAARAEYEFAVEPAKFYVYFLVDPRSGTIFYVGKGSNDRALYHAKIGSHDKGNYAKGTKVEEIRTAGYSVDVRYFASGLSEAKAFQIERKLIQALRRHGLLNIHGGVVSSDEASTMKAASMVRKLLPKQIWLSRFSEEQLNTRMDSLGTPSEAYDAIRNGLIWLSTPESINLQ